MTTRRRLLISAAATAGTLPLALWHRPAPAQSAGFSFDALAERAAQLAGEAFEDPRRRLPEAWRDLSYDDYRKIRFDANQALWRAQGLFEVQLFHPGSIYDHTVDVHVLTDGVATPLPFGREMFDYGDLQPPEAGDDGLGFAGFRLHYPLNRPDYFDEFLVFLGASYFRLVGRGQRYGLSGRGLAIDTATPGGEEFPYFRAFWLEKPAPDATEMTVYALLDSESMTGAYRFVIQPRTEARLTVQARLFARRAIGKLGIAPLTSMFLKGENSRRRGDDYRPEVHDSDGLMIHGAGGEWIWRPLADRRAVTVASFAGDDLRGFGLIQRDRDFRSYEDLEAHYHERPSCWVTPGGSWGAGHVELVEIPTDSEYVDNVVAYWVPHRPVEPGDVLDIAYTLDSYLDHADRPPGGRAVSTRVGGAMHYGGTDWQDGDARLFVIDFDHGELPWLAAAEPVEAQVDTSSGALGPVVVHKNDETGGWRVFFGFRPDGDRPADLRCFLRHRGQVLSETWTYLWTA